MFNVVVDGKEYKAEFDCDRYPMGTSRGDTYCKIRIEDFVTAMGSAECSFNDNFCRNTGRKIALSRALIKLFPDDRDKRKLFWDAYFEARHGKY